MTMSFSLHEDTTHNRLSSQPMAVQSISLSGFWTDDLTVEATNSWLGGWVMDLSTTYGS